MSQAVVPITGRGGCTGSDVVLKMRNARWNVAVIDGLFNGTGRVVPGNVPFFEGDIADRALLERIFSGEKLACERTLVETPAPSLALLPLLSA